MWTPRHCRAASGRSPAFGVAAGKTLFTHVKTTRNPAFFRPCLRGGAARVQDFLVALPGPRAGQAAPLLALRLVTGPGLRTGAIAALIRGAGQIPMKSPLRSLARSTVSDTDHARPARPRNRRRFGTGSTQRVRTAARPSTSRSAVQPGRRPGGRCGPCPGAQSQAPAGRSGTTLSEQLGRGFPRVPGGALRRIRELTLGAGPGW